jgi:hypothetical protein
VDHLLEYTSRYDPAFPSRIEGASAEEIERLERAANVPLPRDYRRFLELMGRNDGGMFGGDETAHSVADMLEFYEHDRDAEDYIVPEDCIAIAVGTISLELVCMELAPPHRVLETWGGKKGDLWAASLRGHLYKGAYHYGASRRRKHRLVFTGDMSKERLPRAERFCEDLGFQRLWFSDEIETCYESAEDSVIAYKDEGYTFGLVLCTDRFLFRRMHFVDKLSRAVGIRLTRQWDDEKHWWSTPIFGGDE